MIKVIIHKIMAIAMACTVMFTTMSFTVDMHYCGDTLVDLAIFKQVKDCGMTMVMPTGNSTEMKGMSCCHDEQIIVAGQDDLSPSFQKMDTDQQQFIVAYYTTYAQIFTNSEVRSIPFDGYPPPDIVADFVILHDQFLI